MRPDLYEKLTSPAGKVSYRLYNTPTPEPETFSYKLPDEMTERQIITAIGGLAILAMHGYKSCLPTKEIAGNLIRKVERAVLEMFRGTGQAIDTEIMDHVCAAWDGTMRALSGEDKL